jgi:hypothetical protein
MIVKAKDEQLQPLQSDHQNSWQLHFDILAATCQPGNNTLNVLYRCDAH